MPGQLGLALLPLRQGKDLGKLAILRSDVELGNVLGVQQLLESSRELEPSLFRLARLVPQDF